jgi:hypothetical protein
MLTAAFAAMTVDGPDGCTAHYHDQAGAYQRIVIDDHDVVSLEIFWGLAAGLIFNLALAWRQNPVSPAADARTRT